jgi:hypothetical protein
LPINEFLFVLRSQAAPVHLHGFLKFLHCIVSFFLISLKYKLHQDQSAVLHKFSSSNYLINITTKQQKMSKGLRKLNSYKLVSPKANQYSLLLP